MIIHITGCSGSGKTTLGLKLAKHGVRVIELDEIEDAIALELLAKPAIQSLLRNAKDRQSAFERFQARKHKIFLHQVRQVAWASKKKSRNSSIALIGATLREAGTFADRKYFIDSTPSVIFERFNLRSMELIARNGAALAKFFSSSAKLSAKDSTYLELVSIFKFEIRGPFPLRYGDAEEIFHRVRERSVKENYQVMSADEIFRDILEAEERAA